MPTARDNSDGVRLLILWGVALIILNNTPFPETCQPNKVNTLEKKVDSK